MPPAGRARVLEELQQGHPGTSRMKTLARSVVWWPKMDFDIEAKVKQCFSCQEHQKTPPAAPLHPWDWPNDHAGPFLGKTFLILVDAHSKWLEVIPVASTSSQATIQALRRVFATHGLPEMLVSDNGTAFTSEEFTQFLRVNGIRPVNAAPYHPASNGLAERAVQTFKRSIEESTPDQLGAAPTAVPVSISHHSTRHNWDSTSGNVVRKTPPFSFGFAHPQRGSYGGT